MRTAVTTLWSIIRIFIADMDIGSFKELGI